MAVIYSLLIHFTPTLGEEKQMERNKAKAAADSNILENLRKKKEETGLERKEQTKNLSEDTQTRERETQKT